MESFDQYTISIKDLEIGKHHFDFHVTDDFFENFDNSEFHKGDIQVDIYLYKESRLITIEFCISGSIETACDRCLENFDLNLNSTNTLYFRFGDQHTEQSHDLIVIKNEDQRIELAQYIYEFICLSVPIKRVHPDDENGRSTCNKNMLSELEDHQPDAEGKMDPRWAILKNIDLN